jgi:hypothetical protein
MAHASLLGYAGPLGRRVDQWCPQHSSCTPVTFVHSQEHEAAHHCQCVLGPYPSRVQSTPVWPALHWYGQTTIRGTVSCATRLSSSMLCKLGELRVSHFCRQCRVDLHIECFKAWHLNVEPVSPKFQTALNLIQGLS